MVIIILLGLYLPQDVDGKRIKIREGQGLMSIAETLDQEGIIKNKYLFVSYAMLLRKDKSLQAGTYLFSGRLTTPTVLYIIASGLAESEDVIVRIPEGFNIWEMDERLYQSGLSERGQFADKYYKDEGKFFPDTYRFQRDFSIGEIAGRMQKAQENEIAELLEGLSSEKVKEIIIMASMLEKEARQEIDMRRVAGVIRRRLRIGMALEIDATVAYGACLRDFVRSDPPKNCAVQQVNLIKEIPTDSLYNTYARKNLPVGPIANPGLKSIKAALNPLDEGYLFYLSTRDGSRMIFSKTGAEHVRNRKMYLGI